MTKQDAQQDKDKPAQNEGDAQMPPNMPVNMIDPRLLDILICPKSRGPLSYDKEAGELISKRAKLAYQIRDGVPIMLVSEARPLK